MFTLKVESQLRVLGLNNYEVKIWTALLSRGVSTAGELSDIANVPRSRSYDVLESLEKKGFVTSKPGKPMKYISVSPQTAIELSKKGAEQDAQEQIKTLVINIKNTNILQRLTNLHTQGAHLIDQTNLISTIRGNNNIYNHIGNMLKKAERFVVISTTQKEFISLVGQFKTVFDKLKKKNITVKILTQIGRHTKKYSDEIKHSVEVRHTNNKARFCIVDGKEMIFMVLDDSEVHPSYDTGVLVNTPLTKDLERLI
ncbi:TrmB family transcriptional regulator [Candidatus Woesearchaeota archaeon]|nr:TrmB family transcriptional regulator [Candidatus Woesearchaeota archaeon]MBI3027705.1 TrmB family transcriptional regulator [Candidatus Woesearchaeota archaeon]